MYELMIFLAVFTPRSWETFLIGSAEPFTEKQFCRNREGRDALRKLTERIYPIFPKDSDFGVRVAVVRRRDVNAFAMAAGRIYVNDGLLRDAKSADELAGVLSHEIEHIKERHLLRQWVRHWITSVLLRPIVGTGFGILSVRR